MEYQQNRKRYQELQMNWNFPLERNKKHNQIKNRLFEYERDEKTLIDLTKMLNEHHGLSNIDRKSYEQ